MLFFFFQAEDGIRDLSGLVGSEMWYKRQYQLRLAGFFFGQALLPAAAIYAAKSQNRSLTFPSIQLHSLTLTCGSLIDHEDFKAHSLRVRLLRNKWVC